MQTIMIEVFHEESVTPADRAKASSSYKKTKFLSHIFLSFAIGSTILLFLSLNMPVFDSSSTFTSFLLYFLPIIIMMAIFYTLYIITRRKKHTYLIDYDYTFISGELRIAKVLNGIKRRAVAKIQVSDVWALGKLSSDKYLRYSSTPNIKKVLATPNSEVDKENCYYMACIINGHKSLLIFQPSVSLLILIKKFASKTIDV